jgi:hypothetical protein
VEGPVKITQSIAIGSIGLHRLDEDDEDYAPGFSWYCVVQDTHGEEVYELDAVATPGEALDLGVRWAEQRGEHLAVLAATFEIYKIEVIER